MIGANFAKSVFGTVRPDLVCCHSAPPWAAAHPSPPIFNPGSFAADEVYSSDGSLPNTEGNGRPNPGRCPSVFEFAQTRMIFISVPARPTPRGQLSTQRAHQLTTASSERRRGAVAIAGECESTHSSRSCGEIVSFHPLCNRGGQSRERSSLLLTAELRLGTIYWRRYLVPTSRDCCRRCSG
jgi:hypothetical protein